MSKYFKTAFFALLDEMKDGGPGGRKMTFAEVIDEVESADMNKTMLKMFKRAGLDYREIAAWYTLLGAFADSMDNRTAGVRAKWRRPSKATLHRDFRECLDENPRLSGLKICEKLKVRHKRKYSEIPATTLLTWISHSDISIKRLKRNARKKEKKAKTVSQLA